MASHKSVRSVSESVCTRLAAQARAARGRRAGLVRASARASVEMMEGRVLLTGTPYLGVHFAAEHTNATFPTGSALAATDSAGVVPMTNWDNATTTAADTLTTLTDATGATAAGVSVSWKANDDWGSGKPDQFTGTGDQKLMFGYLDHGGGTTAATTGALTTGSLDGDGVLFTGLTGSTYDVVVYSLGDTTGRGGTITVTGSNSVSGPNQTQNSTTYVLGKNYQYYIGLHPVNGNLLITPNTGANNGGALDFRDPINGVELLTPPTVAPAAPTGVAATLGVSGASDVSWTPASPTGDNYLVQRSSSASGPWTTLATVGPDASSYTDIMPPQGPLYYQVVAVNDAGQAPSAVAGPVTTTTTPTPYLGIHLGSDHADAAAGDPNGSILAATDVAGVVPMSNWNNAAGASGSMAVTDSAGAATGVTASWHANDVWGSGVLDGFTGADRTLMDGYLDPNGGTAAAGTGAFTVGTLNITAPTAPIVSTAPTGGTVADNTYYVVVTYVNSLGETVGSPIAGSPITTAGGGTSTITVSSPAAATGVTGYNVYMYSGTTAPTANNTLFKQNAAPIALGTNYTLTTPVATTGANPPTNANATPGNGVLLTGLTGSSYDVIVYSKGDGNGRSGTIHVFGSNTEGLRNSTNGLGTYIRGQNYELFVGIKPMNGDILIAPTGSDTRDPINGVELLLPSTTAAPPAPSPFTAALNAAGTAAVLNWTENGSNVQQFFIERATDAAFTQNVTTLAIQDPSNAAAGATATYTDSTLSAGHQYWYRVGSFNDFSGGTETDSAVVGPIFIPLTNSTNPIGVNFASGSNGSTFNVAATDTAGAYPISGWNNETGATGSSSLVLDNSGAATTLGLQWQADTVWDATATSGQNTDAFTGAGDHALMAGYLDDFGLAPVSTGGARATTAAMTGGTLDGIGTLITGLNLSAYDLVVYGQSGGTNRAYSITVDGTGSSTQMLNGVPAAMTQYVLGQNTLVFPDVVPSNKNILILPDTTSFRDDMQGFELLPIATSAPTAVVLTGNYDAANAAADLTWTGGGTNTLLYQVQRSTSANGPWTSVGQALPSVTSAVDSLPLVGQPYYYRLLSTNSFNGGSNAASNVVGPFQAPAGSGASAHYYPQAFWDGQPTVQQIVATVNLNLPNGTPDASIRNSNNSMVFTGQIKANEAGFYTILSNSDDDGYLFVDGVLVSADPGGHGQRDANTANNGDIVTPISLAANSLNDFVFMVNQGGGGEGAHIEWITPSMAAADPAAAPVLVPNTNLTSAIGTPSQPTGLTESTSTTNSVSFTFSSDNNAVVHYQLQRSTDGSNWVTVAQANPSGSQGIGNPTSGIPIEDATALPGTTYQYQVVAMNFDHTSAPSAPVTVTTAPATPQGPGVEQRFYNGEIAVAADGQDPAAFATNGYAADFLAQPYQGIDANQTVAPDQIPYLSIPQVNRFSFGIVYSGQVLTDQAGMYTFITNSSDDGYMYVNGVLVSSDPGTHALRDATNLTPISLAANTAYNFVVIQQEMNSGLSATAPTGMHVSWIEPGQTAAAVIGAASPGAFGGFLTLMGTPDKQTMDASGHVTETAGQSAAGNLTAASSPTGVALTWTNQGLAQLWFEVQRATSPTGPFTTVGSAGFDATGFTDTTAVAGTHYYYQVRGVNFDAAGPFSTAADVVFNPANNTVLGTSGNDTITIKVDPSSPGVDDIWVNAPTTGAPTQMADNSKTIVINGGGGSDTLTVDSTGGQPIPAGATGLQLSGSFTLGGTTPTLDATHTVDLTNASLILPYTGTTILPQVQTLLKNHVIFSSTANGSSGKYAISDTDSGSQISLKYTVIGDVNGDGTVAFADLLALAQHYGQTGADWSKGDLNYDGTVGFADLLALAQHYGQSSAAVATPTAAAASAPLTAAATTDNLVKKNRKS